MHKQWQTEIDTALDVFLSKSVTRKMVNPRYICSIEVNHDTNTVWLYMLSGQSVQLKFQEETPSDVLLTVARAYESLMLNSTN